MMNNKVSFTNSNNPTISLSAVIYFPPKFDETRQYQAIVVSHPGGGVKEQTAGTYAKKLAEKGIQEGVNVRIDVALTVPVRIFKLK